jgi:hypothetical protein
VSIHRRSGREHDISLPLGVDERRASCRYAITDARAWIGWWEGPQFRHVAADIEDVSIRGARVSVERFPPEGQPVWFHPPGAAPDGWLEVRVVEAKKRLFGPRQLQLVFRKTFPYEMFKAVVYGLEAVRGVRPQDEGPEGRSREHGGAW